MTAETRLTPFQQWITNAVATTGIALPEYVDPLGVQFEAEGRLARLIPHADAALAVVEVEARSLAQSTDLDAARLALELMKLNHEARFEHGWSAIIDDDDMLSITTTVTLASTDAEALGALLFDGVERAALLATVADGLLSPSVTAAQAPVSGAADIIRG